MLPITKPPKVCEVCHHYVFKEALYSLLSCQKMIKAYSFEQKHKDALAICNCTGDVTSLSVCLSVSDRQTDRQIVKYIY